MASDETPNLDTTFRNYTPEEAAAYSRHRTDPYSQKLYNVVLDYHKSHGGGFNSLLDVGCGTGQVTKSLAPYFDLATGVDPGRQMIQQAQKNCGISRSGKVIRFEVRGAEDLGSLPKNSVDLLTAGMAAHWFRMDEFWKGAAQIVKPGGSVALWTNSSFFCLPSTPNAKEVQTALSNLEDNILGPYETAGIKLSRGMYDTLPMPWTVEPSVTEFSENNHLRHEWNRNGKLPPGDEDFFGGSDEATLSELAGQMGTTSMVSRWREANPRLVGTDEDCVEVMIRGVAKALGDENGDRDGMSIRAGCASSLLLFSRS